ncbi:hypothetical protein LB507_007556 [Fusarium sp. FIESC RH6]|nr:hypothetical protein LB507_007556 [Fusarium sp. FIESC RH6]
MHFPAFLFLTASLLTIFGSCENKFISPPDERDDERKRFDLEKNRRYVVGETIPLDWETDLDDIRLYIVQHLDSQIEPFLLDSSRTSWEAEYDLSNKLMKGEDTVYYFVLSHPREVYVTGSHYINVTAPKKDTTRTVTAPPSTVTIPQSRPIEPKTTSTTMSNTPEGTESASDGYESNSKSGMSQGEVAGAAVGGLVGALLIFGVAGWLLWMRRSKTDPVDSTAVQYHEQAVETKAELPGNNTVHPSEYAKSPTGIYEAP